MWARMILQTDVYLIFLINLLKKINRITIIYDLFFRLIKANPLTTPNPKRVVGSGTFLLFTPVFLAITLKSGPLNFCSANIGLT